MFFRLMFSEANIEKLVEYRHVNVLLASNCSCSRLEFERYLSTHEDVVPEEKAIVMNQRSRNPRRIRVLESMNSMNPYVESMPDSRDLSL